jgi:transposase
MNKARIIIPTPQEAADRYGVSQSWVSELVTRFKDEGEGAFNLKSQRPHTSPNKLRKSP